MISGISGRQSNRRRLGPALLALLAGGEAGVIIALALLVIVFSLLNDAFVSSMNIRAMFIAVSYIGIIGVGQTILLVDGDFDLSVGSVAGLCAVVSAWLMTSGHLPVPLGLLGGIAVGAGLGFVNGTVVVRFGIPAFIATLGMLFVAAGLTQVVTNGYPIYPIPDSVGNFGAAPALFGVGWSFIILIVLVIGGDLLMRRTTIGRNLYATGGNKEVAQLVGINTNRYKMVCFMLTGSLSAVAGMLVMASLASATTSIGTGWELNCIAGVVVGGVSLFGGVGTVLGGILGMLLLQVVQSGLVVVGVSANWQQVSVGAIMILAVGLDVGRRKLSVGQVHGVEDTALLLSDAEVAAERRTIHGHVGELVADIQVDSGADRTAVTSRKD